MKKLSVSSLALAVASLVWAGVSLGGNLIAAPAKFQVQELTLPVALQVGRAQFTWLGYAEWMLLGIIIVFAAILKMHTSKLFLFAGVIFLIQRLWLMPLLNERSDLIIAQASVPDSNLHLVFIWLEIIKIASLVVAGILTIHSAIDVS